ncbi:L-lactate dehydrogenase [Staphylococcus canis]|uniref:L-lactate dehydrogenase n=1 Tax=Staphylococcus canis TaxID=2724942 RepID=A0ABS0T7M8_9STAP|nr:L-lactate dehydrogenase [Staphylococcus canis]MBI5974682.1 L-lactate dehydrogenase [Staphylococcus canis]
MKKVSIIGSGAVGATTAFLLSEKDYVNEVVIVDIDEDRAKGNAMDMMHGAKVSMAKRVISGGYEDTQDSDVVIITIGVPEKVGESRLIPLQKNADILNDIVPKIVKASPNAKILVVSNPVDILAYLTYKISGLPAQQVIGSGTLLDSSRLSYLLSRDFNISDESIQATVVGEHGDSQVVLWSKTTIGGLPVEDFAKLQGIELPQDYKQKIEQEVKDTAFDVWQMKGPNCYCVANAIEKIVRTILRHERQILPVSNLYTPSDSEEGLFLSRPSIVSGEGVEQQLNFDLAESERQNLQHSYQLMSEIVQQIKL